MGLNVYFSEPVCLCWLTERGKAVWVQCGDLIQCDSKEILPFPSSSNSQHGISSGPVMCRAALVSCAVAAAETAAPGCYRKLQEATGSLSSWGCLGVGDGRTKQLLLIDKSTIYVFTSASQHSMKVVRFVITRCWLGKKSPKWFGKLPYLVRNSPSCQPWLSQSLLWTRAFWPGGLQQQKNTCQYQ